MSGAAIEVPLTVMDHHDPELMSRLLDAVGQVAATGAFTGGAAVEAFEQDYAAWCETPHAVGVSSGTDALAFALRALGVGPGDEVVLPANSFIATAEAVSIVGGRPRFADVERDTQLLSAQTLEPLLGPAVRCVIPVHLFGRTVELAPIMDLTRTRGIHVLEDASQAHGARYRGRRVGTIGDAGAFSLYPAKNLGAWGDAGVVVSADAQIAERVRLLRSHGERPRYHHRVIGTTGRLDAIHAAVLRVKLPRLEHLNSARRRAAATMRAALLDLEPLIAPAALQSGADHVYHQFVVRTPQRDRLRALLDEHGVASAIHYPTPIHRTPAYAPLVGSDDPAPVASALAREILSLPIFPSITDAQIERVLCAVRAGVLEIRKTTLRAGEPVGA